MGANNRRLLKDSIIELMQPISMSLILAFSICFLVVGYSISNPNFTLPVNWGLIFCIWVGLFIISLIVSYFPIQKTLKQDPIKALRNE
jgi:ABC-type lipoprotein release transport system permease subunit